MKRTLVPAMLLTIVASVSAVAQLPATQTHKPEAKQKKVVIAAPDLRIDEYVFKLPQDHQDAKVYVMAEGNSHQGSAQSRNASSFALVASRFKNAGGNYNNLLSSSKVVLVRIMNAGNSATTACRLTLTVRKINGVTANRQKVATVQALAPGKEVWVLIDATSILPNSVEVEATSFKLNVDAANLLDESNESNNEAWHNL